MQELPPREAPQPAGGSRPHVLPRLRLSDEEPGGPPPGRSGRAGVAETPATAERPIEGVPPGGDEAPTDVPPDAERTSGRGARRRGSGGTAVRSPGGGIRLPVALLAAGASGLLMSLANPPVQAEPLAFVALIPLLWAIRRARPRRGMLLGFAFGAVYFLTTLYWILLFGTIAWSALSLASAAFMGVAGAIMPLVWRDERPVWSVIGIAALWTLTEYVRALWPLGGFTWGGLGYTQPDNGFLMPLASITGVWGMSFVVALVNGLVLLSMDAIARRRRGGHGVRRALALLAVAAALVMVPGLIPIPAPGGPRLDVAILQGNDIEHRLPDPFVEDVRIARNYAALEQRLAGNPPDLAVWPEDAIDIDPLTVPQFGALVQGAIGSVGRPAIVGAITGNRQYNEGLLYDGNGRLVDRYQKVHLVPFGEYVPWRSALGWISALKQVPSDLTPGKRLHTIVCPAGDPACGRLAGLPFADVICFENTFPSLDRRLVEQGAQLLVVSTNNASYGRTAASRQHLIMSRLRAVENGRWLVHGAISGISAFVDPHGGVHQETGLFELATDRMTVQASTARTLYTRFGDWFPWACAATVVVLIALPRRRRRPPPPAPLPPNARALVVLPTYNERATIREVVERTLEAAGRPRVLPDGPTASQEVHVAPAADILVVDDGSPDGTAEVVRDLADADPRVRLLERNRKEGLAAAYAAGFQVALREGYDVVVEMDADLSHQPEELPRLLEGVHDHDLAIGSRYVPGGSVTNWGRLRLWLSRGGNAYTRAMLGLPIRDATSGFRAFRRELLAELLESGIHSDGYGFQIELAYRAWQRGALVGEVPITFREREHGHSKISRRIVVEALGLVFVWGVRDRFRWRPDQPDQPEPDADSQT